MGNPFRWPTLAHDDWRYGKNKYVADWKLEQKIVIWLSCLTQDVVAIARRAYDKEDWTLMPVLADALVDAGLEQVVTCIRCDGYKGSWGIQARGWDPDWADCSLCKGTGVIPHQALSHLRSPTTHVQGCWVLDLLLKLRPSITKGMSA